MSTSRDFYQRLFMRFFFRTRDIALDDTIIHYFNCYLDHWEKFMLFKSQKASLRIMWNDTSTQFAKEIVVGFEITLNSGSFLKKWNRFLQWVLKTSDRFMFLVFYSISRTFSCQSSLKAFPSRFVYRKAISSTCLSSLLSKIRICLYQKRGRCHRDENR